MCHCGPNYTKYLWKYRARIKSIKSRLLWAFRHQSDTFICAKLQTDTKVYSTSPSKGISPPHPACKTKFKGTFLSEQYQQQVSTRGTCLIQTDIQISSDAVFVPKRSDMQWKRTGVLNIACLTTHVYGRAEVASERIARLCDDQTTLAEKWKPKSGYHSYFLDSRGANSLPISRKFSTIIQPCILFYSGASNPTWWGFGRCQKLVIIKKKKSMAKTVEVRGGGTQIWVLATFLFAKLNFCVITFFFPSQCDSPLSLDTTGHDNASPCDKTPEQREHACW